MKSILEIAAESDQFKTLVSAVQTAGLADTLKGAGPFTIFAPTDDAFAKLPKGTVEGLSKDPPRLKSVLTYHVVPGRVHAADVKSMKSAKTVQGGELSLDSTHGVKINNAKITEADIEASNGVIHIIDTVLMPR